MKKLTLALITVTLVLLTTAHAAGAQEGQQGYWTWSDDPDNYGWTWNEPGEWQQTPTGKWLYCWNSHGVTGYEGPNDYALNHTCTSNPPS